MLRALLLVACLPALWPAALPAVAQSAYERHVFFDNSRTDSSYFHSAGSIVPPSRLALVDGKIPVDDGRFFTPPNALRLAWTSATGGAWRMEIRLDRWRNRPEAFEGDTLAFWIYAAAPVPQEALPFFGVADAQGMDTRIRLDEHLDGLPAGRWTEIRLPLQRFAVTWGDGRTLDPHRLVSLYFEQWLDDGEPHILYLDEIRIYGGRTGDATPPAAPTTLQARGFERHVELSWTPSPSDDLQGYLIERARDDGGFEPVGIQTPRFNRYVDFTGEPGRSARYRVRAYDYQYNYSEPTPEVDAATRPMDDDALLTMVQEASFRYYWEGAHPDAGLALENIPGDPDMVAVGASGFGLMALLVGIERGFVTRDEGVARMQKVLGFLEKADRFHGAWPHFLDGRTGRTLPVFGRYDNGGDLVETAFLVQGLLAVRQYFNDGTPEGRDLYERITALWEGVEWDWYRREPGSDVLYWHWSPDYAWHLNHPLIGWNETMIVYLLAIASPTHGVPAEMYHTGWAGTSERHVAYRRGWGRTTRGERYVNGHTYYGITLPVGVGSGGPLFFTHYAFLGFDPRGKRDRYANYFDNNRRIAQINRAYCIDNPLGHRGYGADAWGLTASDGPWGYRAHEPVPRHDTGTLTPTGALASFPYTPDASMQALRHFYRNLGDRLWDVYGFRDAINLNEEWVAPIFMGLNQAPIVVMIENHRTGLVWDLFMKNPEIHDALTRIGFVPE